MLQKFALDLRSIKQTFQVHPLWFYRYACAETPIMSLAVSKFGFFVPNYPHNTEFCPKNLILSLFGSILWFHVAYEGRNRNFGLVFIFYPRVVPHQIKSSIERDFDNNFTHLWSVQIELILATIRNVDWFAKFRLE